MGTLNDILPVDNTTDVLAAQYAALAGSSLLASWSNATTMTGTVTLTDSDYALQRFNCNTANRIVKLPAYSTSNHPFVIMNVTGAAFTLTVQTSAAAELLILSDTESAFFVPDGTAGFKLLSTSRVSYPEPDGVMKNGKISVTVASNNLTLALKTLAGNDPSIGDPVKVVINGVERVITAALSVTMNAATNWMNLGAAEHATIEHDLFAYLGYNATDGVTIGASRIPYAGIYSDFNTTNTNERFGAISTITHAAASDEYCVIGRFAATLSAGAGYTWTVPTYTAANLKQYPIWETRVLTYVPQVVATAGAFTTVSATGTYTIKRQQCFADPIITITTNGTASGMKVSLPLSASADCFFGNGRADSVSGKSLQSRTLSLTHALIFNYDNSYPGASGEVLYLKGIYNI